MSTQEKILYSVAVLVLIILISFSLKAKKDVVYTPDPTPSPKVDKLKKYEDMLTQKCYTEDEVETPCKG